MENFDDDAVDAAPDSADFILNGDGPEAFIQVGGPGGEYASPLGAAGNKALVIDNPGQAQPVISWTDEFSDDPTDFTSGTVSFDLYLPEPQTGDDWTYIDVRLGYGGVGRAAPTTVNDTTIWNSFRINRTSADVVMDDGNGTSTATIASGAPLHVVYQIDGAARTYTLTINGSPITFGSGNANRPWRAGAPGVNMIAFVGAYPLSSSPVAIDNLEIIDTSLEPPSDLPPEPTDMLEWHQHRGNKRLTGEATISDDILSGAQILWTHNIASRESWIGVSLENGNAIVAPPVTDIALTTAERVAWGLDGPYFDLAGNGTLTQQTPHSLMRIGDFIPGNGVLEKIEGEVFDTTYGQGVVRLSAYQNGQWVQQWQSPQIPTMHGTANFITGDFDDDGNLEIALTPWTNMYLLDMATGQIERTATFKPSANESGRPYGWFGAYDLTGDGREEFVLMGDFQDFIAVMGWNPSGQLVKLWDHPFDGRLSGKQTTHRPMAFPVRDVTGDGQLDIATSIYNESGDGKWHLQVFNALTGALVVDLADHVIDGSRDVNGDGDFELFVRQTEGPQLPTNGTLKILDWNGADFDVLWTLADSGFVSQQFEQFPDNVNSVAATGRLDLLTGVAAAGGDELFFTQRLLDPATRAVQIDVWQLDGIGGIAHAAMATGIDLDVLALRAAAAGETGILLATETFGSPVPLAADFTQDDVVDGADFLAWQRAVGQSGSLPVDPDPNGAIDGGDLEVWKQQFGRVSNYLLQLHGLTGADAEFSRAGSPPRASAVVARLDGAGSDPTVVVQGGSNSIIALQPNAGGQAGVAWMAPGHGGYTGASQFHGQHEGSGVALADVDGDGALETLYATEGESGQARLVAVDPAGHEVWHADFDVPGGPRVFNQPGLVLWRTGHFNSLDHEDVLVQIMRGIGGTGEFYMLDGRTGETIWTRDYGNNPGTFSYQAGAGEAHMPVYDWDGDGLDEFVNFNPNMFYVVDGNGVNLVQKSLIFGVFPDGSPLYGQPVVADFRNNGTNSILFAGSYAQLGLVDKYGVKVWSTPFTYDNTPGFIQGVGDVDGDGDLDVLSPGHPIAPATYTASKFHAYDGPTGALLWTVDLPGHPHSPVGGVYADTPTLSVSGDIDGDGRVESLFSIGNTLYAVGADPGGASGRIEWTFTPDGGFLGSPVIADANGDGRAEIIVVSNSGMIYGIGNAAGAPSSLSAVASDAPAEAESTAGEASSAPAAQFEAMRSTWWLSLEHAADSPASHAERAIRDEAAPETIVPPRALAVESLFDAGDRWVESVDLVGDDGSTGGDSAWLKALESLDSFDPQWANPEALEASAPNFL